MREEGKMVTIIERNKSSLTLTYRNKKQEDGTVAVEVTGFDVKAYGDTADYIRSMVEHLETLGKEKMAKIAKPSL